MQTLKFRTLKQVQAIADHLSGISYDELQLPLVELMINAVEHGILGITYEQKTDMHLEGNYLDQLNELMKKNKTDATIKYQNLNDRWMFLIEDPGEGFDFKRYLDPGRNPKGFHGRGIMLAKALSDITYLPPGNAVIVQARTSEVDKDKE